MKAIFGVVSLLVALAIVGVLVSKQMKAVLPASGSTSGVAAVPGSASATTPATQSRQIQDKVRSDVAGALQQGANNAAREADK